MPPFSPDDEASFVSLIVRTAGASMEEGGGEGVSIYCLSVRPPASSIVVCLDEGLMEGGRVQSCLSVKWSRSEL